MTKRRREPTPGCTHHASKPSEPVRDGQLRIFRPTPRVSRRARLGPAASLCRVDEERRKSWERAAEWPLTGAAILFLVAYAWPILEPSLSGPWQAACRVTTWVAWASFAVDYVARFGLSVQRWRFVRSNVLDLLVVALPILRPLRLLRLVALLNVFNRAVGGSFRGRVAIYVVGASLLVLFVASLAALDAERGSPDANIKAFPDALWWSATTVTTVGYGDRYPVTGTGRAVAIGLMLAGIALIGVVTATFASWLIERVAAVTEHSAEESRALTRRDISELAAQVDALRAEIADLRGRP